MTYLAKSEFVRTEQEVKQPAYVSDFQAVGLGPLKQQVKFVCVPFSLHLLLV